MRWTDALMLGTALACLLAWTSCDYAVPGEPIARTEATEGWHAATVRHEVAHVLSWCTGRGLDHGHTHRDVRGADGVVWRAG